MDSWKAFRNILNDCNKNKHIKMFIKTGINYIKTIKYV